MNSPETSIIIRTRNEERWIKRVLEKIYRQTYKDFEVVVVDSSSTDGTLSIISKFPVTVVKIKPEEFTFPYALNIGVKNSIGEKYLVLLSAHSLPISDMWLENGIRNFSETNNLMGVYGPVKAMPDGTLWDKVFTSISYIKWVIHSFPKKYQIIKGGCMGVLGFTNAIVRKDLWLKHNFSEEYGGGGEDGEWAGYWFRRGFVAIKDKLFSVHHSHYLNFSQWFKQIEHWSEAGTPKPFKYLKYRTDKAHLDERESRQGM